MSSDISFDIDTSGTPSNGGAQSPPISMSRGRGRVRGVWNECGQIVAIGHRPSPSPIWGRGFGWILLLLTAAGILIKVVDLRDQSLPQLPSSAPTQVR
jgi:hypothetical protein